MRPLGWLQSEEDSLCNGTLRNSASAAKQPIPETENINLLNPEGKKINFHSQTVWNEERKHEKRYK
jgi:hypothetical protein